MDQTVVTRDIFCVGLGQQFSKWLCPVLKASEPDFTVRGICDVNKNRLGRIEKELGLPGLQTVRTFNDLLEVAADRARASETESPIFVISTPPECHFEQAKRCLEAGFHVYVDKPLTPQAVSAQHLVSLAKQKNLKIVVGAQRRFEVIFREFLRAAEGIGEIQRFRIHAHGTFWPPQPFHPENAIIPSGNGYHLLDTLCWLVEELGGHPSSGQVVSATLRRSPNNPSQYAAFEALLCFQILGRPVPVTAECSNLGPPNFVDEGLLAAGPVGEVQYRRHCAPRNDDPGVLTLAQWDPTHQTMHGLEELTNPAAKPDRGLPLKHLLALLSGIETGPEQSTGAHALSTLRLIDAIIKDGLEIEN